MESYSRAMESLAFNIAARIEDLLYVDDINKQSDMLSSPHRTPDKSPDPPLVTGERTPLLVGSCNKPVRCSMGVKRVLTNCLVGDGKANGCGQNRHAVSNRVSEGITSHRGMDSNLQLIDR